MLTSHVYLFRNASKLGEFALPFFSRPKKLQGSRREETGTRRKKLKPKTRPVPEVPWSLLSDLTFFETRCSLTPSLIPTPYRLSGTVKQLEIKSPLPELLLLALIFPPSLPHWVSEPFVVWRREKKMKKEGIPSDLLISGLFEFILLSTGVLYGLSQIQWMQ